MEGSGNARTDLEHDVNSPPGLACRSQDLVTTETNRLTDQSADSVPADCTACLTENRDSAADRTVLSLNHQICRPELCT
jgi:hypothetical protein